MVLWYALSATVIMKSSDAKASPEILISSIDKYYKKQNRLTPVNLESSFSGRLQSVQCKHFTVVLIIGINVVFLDAGPFFVFSFFDVVLTHAKRFT